MERNKLNIGIITFWWSNSNYGQLLQLYAMQQYLIQKGHNAFLIKYHPEIENPIVIKSYRIKRLFKVFNFIKLSKFILLYFLKKRANKIEAVHNRKFTYFLTKYIKSTEEIYSYSNLKNAPPKADVYICGSDQIWNRYEFNLDDSYFLNFGNNDIIRISYAASFGRKNKDFSDSTINIIRPLLAKFDYISVREEDGIDICARAGRSDAKWLLDPTLLLSAEQYRLIAKPCNIESDYCLIYLLGSKSSISISETKKYLEGFGLKIIYIASQEQIDKYEKYFPEVEEFLYLIDNAKYVITNSFHGTVFSILFNKQFANIPIMNNTINRIESLFSMLGIEEKMCYDINDLHRILNNNIDFEYANSIIKKKIEEFSFDLDGILIK